MKPKHQRLAFIIVGLIFMGASVGLILNNFNDNLVFYYSPEELGPKHVPDDKVIRIGGLVKEGSLKKPDDGRTYEFVITDLKADVPVRYIGILPPMFREGQGMVAKGKLENGVFVADNLLTKHDEKYMPPEVAESLKKSGEWEGK